VATWQASREQMRSVASGQRRSDAAIDSGARTSALHRQPMRQRSTRETESVVGRGSTRTESRSLPGLRSSTAKASISPGILPSLRQARRYHRRGTTSSLAATRMAHCSPRATPRAAGGRAMARVERWWGITTATAVVRAIPGMLPICRAAAHRPRYVRRSATDSCIASRLISGHTPASPPRPEPSDADYSALYRYVSINTSHTARLMQRH